MFLKNLVVLSLLFSFSSVSYAMEKQEQEQSLGSPSQIRPSAADQQEHYADQSELNLMWLNSSLKMDQFGLFADEKAERENMKVLVDWAVKNFDAHRVPINMWYDSQTTLPQALDNTQKNLDDSLKHAHIQNTFKFRDIWDVDYIKQNPTVFGSKQHIYFKADLARVAILLRHIKDPDERVARYRFYSDLNIPAASLSLMFTDERRRLRFGGTLLSEILTKYGFALSQNQAGDPAHAYENAFIVLDAENKIACQSLQFGILEINRLRGQKLVDEDYWTHQHSSQIKTKCQIVFASFKSMMLYHAYLKGEYGIKGDQKKMPAALEDKIARYPDPSMLFNLDSATEKVAFNFGIDETIPDYVGFQLAGKVHPGTGLPVDQSGYISKPTRVLYCASEGNLINLTIQVNKPTSSFY